MTVPILILNRNRAKSLRQLVDWCSGLVDRGTIYVLDNDSTYQPTIDYLAELASLPEESNVRVIYLCANHGIQACRFFMRELASEDMKTVPIVLTDADLVPYPDTPNDILPLSLEILAAHGDKYPKVGPCLEINDLPEHYLDRDRLLGWESQFWPPNASKTPCGRGFFADIDTTFAVYRSHELFLATYDSVRLNRPYRLKHVDWYEDWNAPSEEFVHYAKHASGEASTSTRWKEYLDANAKKGGAA